MKIGYLARWNPLEKRSWSGTYYYTYQELRRHHSIEVFQYKWSFFVREWLLLKKQYGKLVLKQEVAVEFLKGYARYFSKQVERNLIQHKPDVLYAPAAVQLFAYARTDIPVIFMGDATFQQLQGYYASYRNLAGFSLKQAIEVDKTAMHKAAHCMMASQWATDSAMHDYGINASKLSVAPLGANLDRIPAMDELKLKKSKTCRLLFLGVEWERKGGDIAIRAFKALQQKGIPVQLTIIGCIPPFVINDDGIRVIPFLNKNDPQESQELYRIIGDSDFLLLPTRAECAGIAFSEASAFGVPSITTNTGGVPTYVQNGVNGYTLPIEDTGDGYADLIADIYTDTERYQALRYSSRRRFEEDLNWEAWGRSFETVLKRINKS
jgi:glycosyltransferase involved in cell wall biosynthesis